MASKILTSRSPGGRLLTIERIDALPSHPADYLERLARTGTEAGYVLLTGDALTRKDEGELTVGILLRPALSPSRGGMLAVLGATALARTVRHHSSLEPMIRWVSDVYAGKHLIAKVLTRAALAPGGGFAYVALCLTLRITPAFAESLGDVVRSVFSSQRDTLADRVAETLITEFYTLYEGYATTDSTAFLDEYRALSLLQGKRIRYLQGGKRRHATVVGIDDDARLVVSPHRGKSVVLSSAAELYNARRRREPRKG